MVRLGELLPSTQRVLAQRLLAQPLFLQNGDDHISRIEFLHKLDFEPKTMGNRIFEVSIRLNMPGEAIAHHSSRSKLMIFVVFVVVAACH